MLILNLVNFRNTSFFNSIFNQKKLIIIFLASILPTISNKMCIYNVLSDAELQKLNRIRLFKLNFVDSIFAITKYLKSYLAIY